MKKLFTLFLCLCSLTVLAQQYTIDTKASSLTWTGHAQTGVYSPKGTLQLKSGTLTLSRGKLIAGKVTVDMGSLKTENGEMQEHLRGKDFFDIEKFPEAVLTMTGNGTGKLTIKGITQPIHFDFSVNSQTVKAQATVDRTLYGIKYNSASFFQDLGNYAIRNTFEIEVTLVSKP